MTSILSSSPSSSSSVWMKDDNDANPTAPASTEAYFYAKYSVKSSMIIQCITGDFRGIEAEARHDTETTANEVDIVLQKENVLELMSMSRIDGSVRTICEQSAFGKIVHMNKIRIGSKDFIVLLGESGYLSVVRFSTSQYRFVICFSMRLSPPGTTSTRSTLGHKIEVDNGGRAVCISAFEDLLSIFPVSAQFTTNQTRFLEEGIQYRFRGVVWDYKFLPQTLDITSSKNNNDVDKLYIAVLMFSHAERTNVVQILECSLGSKTVRLVLSQRASDLFKRESHSGVAVGAEDDGMSELIDLPTKVAPVPNLSDHFILFRESSLILLEFVKPGALVIRAQQAIPTSTPQQRGQLINSYTWQLTSSVNNNNTERILYFVTEYGTLFSCTIRDATTTAPKLDLNQITRCANSFDVFECVDHSRGSFLCAAQMGDSGIYNIDFKDGGVQFEKVYDMPNLAPILDFAPIYEESNNEEKQILICSGGSAEAQSHYGRVRLLRNGYGVNCLLNTPPNSYQGVNGMWTLKSHYDLTKLLDTTPESADPSALLDDRFLVLSFVGCTRVMSVGPELEDLSPSIAFDTENATLDVSCVALNTYVQVTEKSVLLVQFKDGTDTIGKILSRWDPPMADSDNVHALHISVCAISHSKVVVTLSKDNTVVTLDLLTDRMTQGESIQQNIPPTSIEHEVSSLALPSLQNCASLYRKEYEDICVIATYKPSIQIIKFVREGDRQSYELIQEVNLSELSNSSNKVNVVRATASPSAVDTYRGEGGVSCAESLRIVCFNGDSAEDTLFLFAGLRDGQLLIFQIHPETFHLSERPTMKHTGVYPVKLVHLPLSSVQPSHVMAVSNHTWLISFEKNQFQFVPVSMASSASASEGIAIGDSDILSFVSGFRSSEAGILDGGFVAVTENNNLQLLMLDFSMTLNVKSLNVKNVIHRALYNSNTHTVLMLNQNRQLLILDLMASASSEPQVIHTFEQHEYPFSVAEWDSFGEQFICVGTQVKDNKHNIEKGRLVLFRKKDNPKKDQQGESSPINSGKTSHKKKKVTSKITAQYELAYETRLPGIVYCIRPYRDKYLLVSASSRLLMCTLVPVPRVAPPPQPARLRSERRAFLEHFLRVLAPSARFTGIDADEDEDALISDIVQHEPTSDAGASAISQSQPKQQYRFKIEAQIQTRYFINAISCTENRIAIADRSDSVIFVKYKDTDKPPKFELLNSDLCTRCCRDVIMVDDDFVVALDKFGSFFTLRNISDAAGERTPVYRKPLPTEAHFYIGEGALKIKRGTRAVSATSASSKPATDTEKTPEQLIRSASPSLVAAAGAAATGSYVPDSSMRNSFIVGTMNGTLVEFIELSLEEFRTLKELETLLQNYSAAWWKRKQQQQQQQQQQQSLEVAEHDDNDDDDDEFAILCPLLGNEHRAYRSGQKAADLISQEDEDAQRPDTTFGYPNAAPGKNCIDGEYLSLFAQMKHKAQLEIIASSRKPPSAPRPGTAMQMLSEEEQQEENETKLDKVLQVLDRLAYM